MNFSENVQIFLKTSSDWKQANQKALPLLMHLKIVKLKPKFQR